MCQIPNTVGVLPEQEVPPESPVLSGLSLREGVSLTTSAYMDIGMPSPRLYATNTLWHVVLSTEVGEC